MTGQTIRFHFRGKSGQLHKMKLAEAVKMTAQKLGNRPSACRAYYIHPAIPAAYLDGRLFDAQKVATSETGLHPEERIALGLVQHHSSLSST